MSPTKYCPATNRMIIEGKTFITGECKEGDGYYCIDYCPYAPPEEMTEEDEEYYSDD